MYYTYYILLCITLYYYVVCIPSFGRRPRTAVRGVLLYGRGAVDRRACSDKWSKKVPSLPDGSPFMTREGPTRCGTATQQQHHGYECELCQVSLAITDGGVRGGVRGDPVGVWASDLDVLVARLLSA